MIFIRPGQYDHSQWNNPKKKNILGFEIGHNAKIIHNEKEKKGQHVA
jgi:hypothetical protein